METTENTTDQTDQPTDDLYDLFDAEDGSYIGEATDEQVEASDRGQDGIFLALEDGTPVRAGSWDAENLPVRRVYTMPR